MAGVAICFAICIAFATASGKIREECQQKIRSDSDYRVFTYDPDRDNDRNCTYRFAARKDQVIALEFLNFSTNFDRAHLDIYDGANTREPLVGCMHGKRLPPNLYSSGRYLTLRLDKHEHDAKAAFAVRHRSIDRSESFFTPLVANCDYITIDKPGHIESPSSIHDHTDNMYCYLIKVDDDRTIDISFDKLRFQTDDDYINVYDGPNITSPMIVSFNKKRARDGENLSVKGGNTMLVLFRVRNPKDCRNLAPSSFSARYKEGPINATRTPPRCSRKLRTNSIDRFFYPDVISYDGSLTGIGNLEYCLYTVQVEEGKRIEFAVTLIHTEAEHDTVTLYDGEYRAEKRLVTFSGHANNYSGNTTGNIGLIEIKSNSDTPSMVVMLRYRTV